MLWDGNITLAHSVREGGLARGSGMCTPRSSWTERWAPVCRKCLNMQLPSQDERLGYMSQRPLSAWGG